MYVCVHVSECIGTHIWAGEKKDTVVTFKLYKHQFMTKNRYWSLKYTNTKMASGPLLGVCVRVRLKVVPLFKRQTSREKGRENQ